MASEESSLEAEGAEGAEGIHLSHLEIQMLVEANEPISLEWSKAKSCDYRRLLDRLRISIGRKPLERES